MGRFLLGWFSAILMIVLLACASSSATAKGVAGVTAQEVEVVFNEPFKSVLFTSICDEFKNRVYVTSSGGIYVIPAGPAC